MGNVQPTLLCTTLHHNSIVDTYAIRLNFTLSDLVLQPGETVDAKFVDFSALEDSSCESWLPEPIAYRLRTALPLLKRFLEGAECTDMYSLDGHPLGYSRLRLCDGVAPQFPRETCLVPLLFLMSEEGRMSADTACGRTRRRRRVGVDWRWTAPGRNTRAGNAPRSARGNRTVAPLPQRSRQAAIGGRNRTLVHGAVRVQDALCACRSARRSCRGFRRKAG